MSRIPPTEALPPDEAEEQLRQNLRELMEWRRMTQADLAAQLGRSQPWVSKRMSGVNKFQVEDLDELARVFMLTPTELLHPGYGQWDRRTTRDRRTGNDRRQSAAAYRLHTREDLRGTVHGTETHTLASGSVDLALALTTLVEQLEDLAARVLGGRPATPGDAPSSCSEDHPGVRDESGSPRPRKIS
jgi:transcriptional regulator with XRE-family HTH domain